MDSKPQQKKSITALSMRKHYAGAITPVVLSAISAWLIVTGLKDLLGFAITRQTLLADLLGIFIVVAVARWMQRRVDAG